jgi:hypothetical protein
MLTGRQLFTGETVTEVIAATPGGSGSPASRSR